MRRMYSQNQLETQIKEVKKDINTLVDSDGHDRFIEGDVNLLSDVVGITKTYGKWSLSGTHLMIVFAGSIPNGTEWVNKTFSVIDMPDWIKDKIVPVHSVTVVEQKTLVLYGGTAQNATVYLEKNQQGRVSLYLSSITANADKTFRISFDLLIDND